MTYRPHEFSEIAGVSVRTLQRWDKAGKLQALRTQRGHRYYTDEHVNKIKGLKPTIWKSVIYCRVSSHGQNPELQNQVEAMHQFCTAREVSVDEVIKEVGGGMNFIRKKFVKLIAQILAASDSIALK